MRSLFYSQSQQLILVYIFFCFYLLFLLKHRKDISNQQDQLEGKINRNWKYQKSIDSIVSILSIWNFTDTSHRYKVNRVVYSCSMHSANDRRKPKGGTWSVVGDMWSWNTVLQIFCLDISILHGMRVFWPNLFEFYGGSGSVCLLLLYPTALIA